MATLFAVGVGPGDPELLTRKAERVLRRVDVVLAPVSNPAEASVALATVREFLDEGRQEVVVHQFPMTSDTSRLTLAWQEAAGLIAARIAAGKDVALANKESLVVAGSLLTALARPYSFPSTISAPYGSCVQPSPGGTTSPCAFSAMVGPMP